MSTPIATVARDRASHAADKAWSDRYWWSADGLRLHYRLYGEGQGGCPILCIPGLMRNARDFEALAPHLAQARPVYVIELRGRGESAYAKDPMSYAPLTYVQDILALLESLGLGKVITIGTSLGGLCSMLLAAMQPGRIVAAVLNDVGPELDPAGMQRIRGLVGAGGSQPTWLHAARQIGEANALIFPNYTVHDWLRMVKRTHRLTPEGRIVADYDKQIAAPFRAPVDLAGQDLWPAFAGMKEVPMVLVRGALSDILPSAVARRMRDEARKLSIVEIADVGHAPTLDEPEAVAAIDALLSAL